MSDRSTHVAGELAGAEVFMTGYAESAAVAGGFLQPGMEMITEPFDLGDLSQRIRQMIAA